MFRRILELAINDITLRHCTIANKSRSTRPKLFFNTVTMAKSNTGGSTIKPQNYNYFLVLDFEATCSKGRYLKPQVILLCQMSVNSVKNNLTELYSIRLLVLIDVLLLYNGIHAWSLDVYYSMVVSAIYHIQIN